MKVNTQYRPQDMISTAQGQPEPVSLRERLRSSEDKTSPGADEDTTRSSADHEIKWSHIWTQQQTKDYFKWVNGFFLQMSQALQDNDDTGDGW